jgi:hypothetical protein
MGRFGRNSRDRGAGRRLFQAVTNDTSPVTGTTRLSKAGVALLHEPTLCIRAN